MSTSTIHIKIKPRVFNEKYFPYLHNDKRYEIFYGGAGSGKSYFVAQKKVYQHLKEKGHKTLIVRKVARSNRHSTFDLIKNIIYSWQLSNLFKIKENDMEIKCVNGNHMIFTGLDDVEKLKSIAGITDMWIEEATEITESDFEQLNLRLRGKSKFPKQITLTFNPISSSHWLKKRFFDRKTDDASILMTTYKDNKFIDTDYRKVLEELKEQDEMFYRIYALGEWGVLENLVYSNYEVVSDVPDHFDEVIYGLDFGYNNPTALVKIGILDERLYILDEMYERGLTNADLIDQLRRIVESTNSSIYADSAEPNRIEEIRRAGFNIYPANKSVKDGIDFVKRHRLYIHASCTNVIKEIESYKWKKDKDGNVLEEPIKFMDHAMDAIRYAIFTHFTQIRTIETANIDIF